MDLTEQAVVNISDVTIFYEFVRAQAHAAP